MGYSKEYQRLKGLGYSEERLQQQLERDAEQAKRKRSREIYELLIPSLVLVAIVAFVWLSYGETAFFIAAVIGAAIFLMLLWLNGNANRVEEYSQAREKELEKELAWIRDSLTEQPGGPKKHNFTTYVAGTSYRKYEAEACRPGQKVSLFRDPENPHDPNAVEVWVGSLHIGFIPRDEAEGMAPMMDSGEWVHKAYVSSLFGDYGVEIRVIYYRQPELEVA